MTNDFINGFFTGAFVALITLYVAAHFFENSWEGCAKQGYFIHENQKYECKPTGEWVEE